jgi:GNAT superfamily N-acetyltransferase
MSAGGERVRVRRMTVDDVADVDRLLRAAYDIERPYRHRIEAHLRQRGIMPLLAEYDGRTAGTVFGNDYGTSAYVSMMGVDPTLQRRGIANALMIALIAWFDERGFRDVRLDATAAGAPLYERFGFADFGETAAFGRERVAEPRAVAARSADATRAAVVARIDAAAFGADRSPVLEPLLAAHGALVAADARGYAVVQRLTSNAIVGPWIAHDPAVARELLDDALAELDDREVALFVPATNPAAMELAAAAGFVERRRLRHMIRGAGSMPSPMVFGRANLGQG